MGAGQSWRGWGRSEAEPWSEGDQWHGKKREAVMSPVLRPPCPLCLGAVSLGARERAQGQRCSEVCSGQGRAPEQAVPGAQQGAGGNMEPLEVRSAPLGVGRARSPHGHTRGLAAPGLQEASFPDVLFHFHLGGGGRRGACCLLNIL